MLTLISAVFCEINQVSASLAGKKTLSSSPAFSQKDTICGVLVAQTGQRRQFMNAIQMFWRCAGHVRSTLDTPLALPNHGI